MDYPLIFTLSHEVRSKDFWARVVSTGRALMTVEDGEWWCFGVEPGGIAENGADPWTAYGAFKAAYHSILQDLALESSSLDAFAESVKTFVFEKDKTDADRWERARAAIRAGEDVAEPFGSLQRVTWQFVASTSVKRLEQLEPGPETLSLAEAA